MYSYIGFAPVLLLFLASLLPLWLLLAHNIQAFFREGARARAEVTDPRDLAAFDRRWVVVRGRVDVSSSPVYVELEQHLAGYDVGTRTPRWRTAASLVKQCAPFRLRLSTGQRLEVEPRPGTEVHDQLALISRGEDTSRIVALEIRPAQELYVEGKLKRISLGGGGAFRAAPSDWCLQAAHIATMPAREYHGAAAGIARKWVRQTVAGLLLVGGLGLWPLLDLYFNTDVLALVVADKHIKSGVPALLLDDKAYASLKWQEVDAELYQRAEVGKAVPVIRWGSLRPSRPRGLLMTVFISAFFFSGVLACVYLLERRGRRREKIFLR